MIVFIFSSGLFLGLSSVFHFLNPKFVDKKLTDIKNIRIIGVTLMLIGIWGILIDLRTTKILGFFYICSGAWRAFLPRSSIKFQTTAYPRWVHGIFMAIASILIFSLLSPEIRNHLRLE